MDNGFEHLRLEELEDGVQALTLDRSGASSNVLTAEVLEELGRCLDRLHAQPPAGLVIRSAKPGGFLAGADVRAFAELRDRAEALAAIRLGQGVMDRIAALPCASVALIHGYCLGGGLELALACDYRVARNDPGTRLGLPEVRLGIHPGFGGTLRSLQRLGVPRAMDLMLSGRSVSGRAARRMGLVEQAVPERHLLRAGLDLIRRRPSQGAPGLGSQLLGQAWARPAVAALLRRQVAARARPDHYPAPYALIRLWQRHGIDSPQALLEAEGESVAELITGPTAQNLVRAFLLSERLKGLARAADAGIRRVHVVGAGAMGGDIAAWCALSGLQVTLQDQSPQRIAPAIGRAHKTLTRRLKDPRKVRDALDRLLPDPKGLGVPRADLVIEAIFEDPEAKRALFRELEPRLADDAILASNTSSLPLEDLAEGLDRPERLVGLHFFNPVAKMQLVEVVRGQASGEDALDRATAFVRAIDRLPLPVASQPGFLVNRVLMPYLMEAVQMADEGIPMRDIDRAAVAFGMPVGPIALADQVGLDVCLHVAEFLSGPLGREVPDSLRYKVGRGDLGNKSGRGYYEHGRRDPWRRLRALWPAAGRHDHAELSDRLILPMVNEAMRCVREGVVTDADLADAGMIYGTGFAPFRGGPLAYARGTGHGVLAAQLEGLASRHGDRFTPDPGWSQG